MLMLPQGRYGHQRGNACQSALERPLQPIRFSSVLSLSLPGPRHAAI